MPLAIASGEILSLSAMPLGFHFHSFLTMKYLLLLCCFSISLLCSCQTGFAGSRSATVNYDVLGKRIWQNECGGTVQGLVSWNDGEAFPSLGIGHFIWFPRGLRSPFKQSFPTFVAYAEKVGVSVPSFFNGPAPWPNKRAYLRDKSGRANAMRRWLNQNIDVQARFIVQRSRASLIPVVKASRSADVKARFLALARTQQGIYCLVDYVNFKGEGLRGSKLHNGVAWGLLQVLSEMRGRPQNRAATAEFSRAAKYVLRRRIANSPAYRNEKRWLAGWMKRCDTYR